jgi:hypothetical protein
MYPTVSIILGLLNLNYENLWGSNWKSRNLLAVDVTEEFKSSTTFCLGEAALGEPTPRLVPLYKSKYLFKLFMNITNIQCLD